MKTVLIVEDEKMIRQGIKTMVQRSGVSIDEILEASNGEIALDILNSHSVDLMFTDIRMPKMDGIQLVQEVQKLNSKPEIVAISGFDDFSYAVEMLRNGVREYILKPVERDKIVEIMVKLEAEYQERSSQSSLEKQLGKTQIRHFLEDGITEEELELLIKKYEAEFIDGEYVICVAGKDLEPEARDKIIFVSDMPNCNLCIIPADMLEDCLKNEMWDSYVGISCSHKGIREIRIAYDEACKARKTAFYSCTGEVYADGPKPRIPEIMLTNAAKQLEETAWNKRLHIVGTEHTEDIEKQWNNMFEELKRGHIVYEDFEEGIRDYLKQLKDLYGSIIDENDKKVTDLSTIYCYASFEEYKDSLLGLILQVHNRINEQPDDSKTQQKIKQAIAYIEANYDRDLNMAVVSNEISMNYSLFSFAFKQYAGCNFVTYLRDLRLEKAKKLLAETDMKIIDISQRIGYDNEKHFMKVFKSVFGVSPTEYRKNMGR